MELSVDTTLSFKLRVQLAAFSMARTITNTGHRMVYPFLPVFARGLGVDLETIALAVTARSALGLISPLFGSLADTRGRRVAMVAALAIFAVGMGLVAIFPIYPVFFLALLLASAGKLIYDPAMQAFVGDHVHYTRRGMAIAITEMSWSGAFLLGVPAIGWLIDQSGYWQAPFPLLALLAVGAAVMLWNILPPDRVSSGTRSSLAAGARVVFAHRAALAGLTITLLLSIGNEMISIVYGAWMEESFGLKVAALGAASAVIGIAELSGEGLVAGNVDRLGKRRAWALGIGSNALACLLLPVIGFNVVGALAGLFLFFITFEFAVVSSIPLMTELVPAARGTLLAGNMAMFSVGRMIGSLAGTFLFNWMGLAANGVVAAGMNLVALGLLAWFIQQD